MLAYGFLILERLRLQQQQQRAERSSTANPGAAYSGSFKLENVAGRVMLEAEQINGDA
jgi:hypothetical protein